MLSGGDKDWPGWSPTWMLGHRIWGKRLGIIGMGRIGQAVARRAAAFGLQIHYHNRRRVPATIEEELNATYWESLDQMLARMDIISVNCPHTPATFHLLSARRLALLRPTAIIVNTSRGEVIDEAALTRMLRSKQLAGAGLDVFEHEPAINPKLRELDNVVLLPHMGSATIEGLGGDAGRSLRLEIQNEHLVALEDGRALRVSLAAPDGRILSEGHGPSRCMCC